MSNRLTWPKFVKTAKMVIVLSSLPILALTCKSLHFTNTIKEKSDVEMSMFYIPLESSTRHSPYAFDSDYTWVKKVRLRKSDYRSIVKQIEDSRFFRPGNSIRYGFNVYDSLRIHELPGYWIDEGSTYEFNPSYEAWAESTNITIDKKKRTLEMTLVHL